MTDDLVIGPDGLARCGWAASTPDYVAYHDDEWGVPVAGDDAVFERISLEAFQSGLSWLTILRKRPAFREAFAGFRIPAVARFGGGDIARLLGDAGIVRNRAKIEATIVNARAAASLLDAEGEGALESMVRAAAPTSASWRRQGLRRPPRHLSDLPATTAESRDLARGLKQQGFRFVGPTTAYAAMQAMGVVDDHLVGCHRRRG